MNIQNFTHKENFISLFNPDELLFCDQIIQYFESRKELHLSGSTSSGINSILKSTTEISITPNHIEKDFIFIEDYMPDSRHYNKDYDKVKAFLIKNIIGV